MITNNSIQNLVTEQPLQYFPFQTGNYSVAAGLKPLQLDENKIDKDKIDGDTSKGDKIFEIDNEIAAYLDNKNACRQEDISKYYLEHQVNPLTQKVVCELMINRLITEYPNYFELTNQANSKKLFCKITGNILDFSADGKLLNYEPNNQFQSLFDALCSQIQEDVAVFQLDEKSDWLSMIHLSSPNYWSPAEKIGKDFSIVHAPIPGMAQMLRHYRPMLDAIVKKGSFQRFAWGVATDKQLNHHPLPPLGISLEKWQGRSFDAKNPHLFVRVERQTLTGFQAENAILFTIRTYFLDVKTLPTDLLLHLKDAILSMSSDSQIYKGVKENYAAITNWLSELAEMR